MLNKNNKMKIVREDKKKIPLFYPYISKRAISEVVKVLKSKFIGQGPKVQKFEIEFAKKFNAEYAVSTNSCTSALHLAYILAGVGQGDEVVGPLLTCSATWHPVLQLGAKPVFVDIKNDMTIDPDKIEEAITPKTKAIVVMHYGGCMCDMDKIMRIAEEYNLPVIEDVAQALGAKYKGKDAGTIGDFGCFSFQAIKFMTTIDGGMLTINKTGFNWNKKNAEENLYQKAKRIRWFGIDRDLKIEKGWEQYKNWETREMTYDVDEIGYKYHMNDFNAAIGLVHLKELNKIHSHYFELRVLYYKELVNCDGIEFLPSKIEDVTWLMTLLFSNRDRVAKALRAEGIETNVVHIRSDVYKLFKPFAKKSFEDYPEMSKIERQYLCLPIHMKISKSQVKKICKIIKENA